ncbi:MAG: hypothetical protein RR131_09290, partial [Anaerovorax sp.]
GKVIVLAVIVFLGVVLLSFAYNKYQGHTNETYTNMPYHIELANTGSSHGVHGLDYTGLGYTTFNFALDSQSMVYDYNLVHYYRDHFQENGVVLIVLSYFSFWGDEFADDMFEAKNRRYFAILDQDHMRFKSEKEKYLSKYFSVAEIADNHIRTVFKTVEKEDSQVKNPQEGAEYSIEEVGELRAKYHLTFMEEKGVLKPMVAENVMAVEHLITLCQDHKLQPVLITTPYLSYYNKWFDQDMKASFYKKINGFVEKYQVPYWDYSADDRFANSEKYFLDTDHLNEVGAKTFTSIVVEDLKEAGML